MQPLISICVLTYNNLDYLHNCLQSICEQSYDNIELIVSDDGTEGFSKGVIDDILTSLPNKLNRVQVLLSKQNTGIVANANRALNGAAGKYIKLLGADDCLSDENCIEDFMAFAQSNDAYVVIAKSAVYDKNMQKQLYVHPERFAIRLLGKGARSLWQALTIENMIGASGVFYSREAIRENGLLNANYKMMDDWPVWLTLLHAKRPYSFFNRVCVKYREGGVSSAGDISPAARLLREDYLYMQRIEVLPHIKTLPFLKMREVRFCLKRFEGGNALSLLPYADIILWRKVRALVRWVERRVGG